MARRIPLEGAEIEVVAAFEHWDGFYDVIGVKKPGGKGCWCMSYRDTSIPDRGAYMKAECEREPGPGVLAYVDGSPAGWCSIAPRSTYRRLMNSRTIPFVDDEDAWSAVCFVVKPAYRGQGLMNTLLEGAVRHARDHGARFVEGYPVETDDGRVDIISGYVGTTTLFERAGFERTMKTTAHSGGRDRWIMRKQVS